MHHEANAWRLAGGVWKRLAGNFDECGFSFEWHDFQAARDFDWGKSFHPGSFEICLNLEGHGEVKTEADRADFAPLTTGFYSLGSTPLQARRAARERHQFITLEVSLEFLSAHVSDTEHALHPLARRLMGQQDRSSGAATATRLTTRQQELVGSLRRPPVFAPAQALWYRSKALELIAEVLFSADAGGDLFCIRQHHLAKERVGKTVALLRANLAEPLTLDELGRQVGCSSFYLSRTFSKEMGMTIPQFLRQIRMERAAGLLASGKFNVTETALEVGYSSLSHFSQAFCQTMGCCPNLYPLIKNASAGLKDG